MSISARPDAGPRRTTAVATGVAATLLDWSSKVVASATLDDGPVTVAAGLSLRLGHNPGIAFGLGDRLPTPATIALTGAVTMVLGVAMLRGRLPSAVGAGLILGGAVGNLGDRLLDGSVVDFVDLTWWPSFNLADVFLTVGVIWTIVSPVSTPDDAGDVVRRGHRSRDSLPDRGPR